MNDAATLHPAPGPLRGTLRVPGDKSVAHRAAMFGALAEGETIIHNFGPGADNRSTLHVLRALGAELQHDPHAATVRVLGKGRAGLRAPAAPLDCGNSGTTLRLLTGVLVGLRLDASLSGDASLNSRPMRRIAAPLTLLGGAVEAAGPGGAPPVIVRGDACAFTGGHQTLPIASAQVKSALLLAALCAGVPMRVEEPSPSRDHTEVMLRAFGVPLSSSPHYHDPATPGPAWVELPAWSQPLQGRSLEVPGDISSAAFLLVAAALLPGSQVRLTACGATPTRAGVLDVLRRVGVDLHLENHRSLEGGEPAADLLVRGGPLAGFHLPPEEVPRAVDEIPVLAVLAAFAHGTSRLCGLAELRVKECDRLERTRVLLHACGVNAAVQGDDLIIEGRAGAPFEPFDFDATHDHRMAAAAAVAALVARAPCVVRSISSLAVSYPDLLRDLEALQNPTPTGDPA
jgi:3-phosphoshikimate 1-carboxyvinyltransferase